MAKWIGGLLATVLAGIILMLAEDPVKDFISGEGLTLTVMSGPWAPLPKGSDLQVANPEGALLTEYEIQQLLEDENSFARFSIVNHGRTPVQNARIIFDNGYSKPTVFLRDGRNHDAAFIDEAENVDLPELLPGDEVELLVWSPRGMGYPFYLDEMRTISSVGPFRVRHYFHSDDGVLYNSSSLVDSIFSVLHWLVIVSLGIVTIILIIGEHVGTVYWKKLLKDESFYLDERVRYEDSPSEFIPDFHGKAGKR